MKQTTKGFLAGLTGIGLLVGGTTFALWTDSDRSPGGTIAAGTLQVEVHDANWRDISMDRRDRGHEIQLDAFKIIPGDVIQAKYPVRVALEGDNMVAQLRLVRPGKNTTGELAAGLDISYEIQDANGRTVATAGRRGATVTLVSADNLTNRHHIAVDAQTKVATFDVVVTIAFDRNTSERELTETQAILADAELELKQVRGRTQDARN